MKKLKTYRHCSMLDCDLYVLTVYKTRLSGVLKVKGVWISRSSGNVLGLDKVTIDKSELFKWKDVSDEYNN